MPDKVRFILVWHGKKQLLEARGCFFCREFIACGGNDKRTANETTNEL